MIAVALSAVASCAAFAQSDSDADGARRQRNMDEVLAKHHVDLDRMDNDAQAMPAEHRTLRERTRLAAAKTREKAHEIAETAREDTHKVAQSTRDATHRASEKMRDFGARHSGKTPDGAS
jgi:hypothetical protein